MSPSCSRKPSRPESGQRCWAGRASATRPQPKVQTHQRHPVGCKVSDMKPPATRPPRQLQSTTNNHHRHSRRNYALAGLVVFVAFAFLSCDAMAESKASRASNSTTAPNTNTTLPSGQARRTKSAGPDPSSPSTKSASKLAQANLDSQPSELSSMYVRIPIADPLDATASSSSSSSADPDGQQQVAADGETADSTKATTWTGPWPKKFQIGYIKQSDLHQVLMESLKNDPYLGSKKPAASQKATTAATKTSQSTASPQEATKSAPVDSQTPQAPPSDASSLMQSAPYPKLKAVQSAFGRLQHHQQPFHQQQQQARQYQWPAVNSYGRLASPQVQPRPNAMMGYLGAKNSIQQAAGPMFNQHQHRPLHHNHQVAMMGHHNQHQNNYRQHANYRQSRFHHQQPQMGLVGGQQQAFKYGPPTVAHQMPATTFHQQPGLTHLQQQQQQQQQQLQFAGSPPLSSQPIYSINNFAAGQQPQQQQTIDAEQMELIQLTNAPASAPKTKSDYYLSSWRPVQTSEDAKQQQQIPAGEFGTDNGFDDEFGAPATGSQNSMNKHPVLSNFLQSGGSSETGKTSPAKMIKQQAGKTSPGTKPAAKGATKGFDADSVQQRQEGTKSDTGRRALPASNSTSASSTTTEANFEALSTTQPTTTSTGESSSSTQATPTSTAASPSGGNQTTVGGSGAETTTEPDSEVFESDNTEPSSEGDEAATTTGAPSTTASDSMAASGSRSTSAAPTLQTPSSSTPNSVQQSAEGAEAAEVATQGQQASSGAFPAIPQSSDSESTTASSAASQSTTTTVSSREETTPSSGGAEVEGASTSSTTTPASDDSSSAAAKTDASMSDEALMAAVRASDLTKSNRIASGQRQRSKTSGQSSGTKKARSSERIVQPGQSSTSTSGARKTSSQQQAGNRLITRKPSAQRSSKQQSAVKGATSGRSASLARGDNKSAVKSASNKKKLSGQKSGAKSSAAKSNKFTRMAGSLAAASGPQPSSQMVSMTAAQAQSAAQTLASLLLSRCLSTSNCSHLLDVCSTKQAAVPFESSQSPAAASSTTEAPASPANASIAAAWSMPVGLVSSNLMSLMQALQADKALQLFPAWREAIENVMDQDAPTGYTLIMPSNEAVDRLALAQIDALLANGDQMSQLIDNHILDSAETIELSPARTPSGGQPAASLAALRQRHQTRFIRSKGLQINQHRDRMVTINGKRVVYANQRVPGGRIHVIDGLLDSAGQPLGQPPASAPTGANNRLPDIMDTLRQCDKFDGFVTLAEGTGLTQILKQDEPLTVFVPSNEALRRIPDEELEVIKNNSTALREFIMYHIVNGSYFSQDLRDGQQLASILDMRPIQVGVRVDGCSRRLVEANTSPMRRPDIVARNGVIHILDWYLTTRDNEWCDPIGRASGGRRDNAAPSSERVQQLASEQVASISEASVENAPAATGSGDVVQTTNLPPNHKPAAAIISNDMDAAASNNNFAKSATV